MRAVAAVAQAQRLLQAAAAIRRFAGGLTYHPMTGRRPQTSPQLLAALAAVDGVVQEIQRAADDRAREEVAVAASGGVVAGQIRLGHAAVDEGVQTVTAALDVLRGALAAADGAVLDAPYGHGAPSRVHPGALCTLIAERVESLASALEASAIVKANLGRAGRSPAVRSGA